MSAPVRVSCQLEKKKTGDRIYDDGVARGKTRPDETCENVRMLAKQTMSTQLDGD
jgi:hypothetical protein